MKEEKLFEYDELNAMGMLIAAKTAAYMAFEAQGEKDVIAGRKKIEEIVKETIAIRWDSPQKFPKKKIDDVAKKD
jgi:hypothetical protein